jgi:hypothetical protein
LELRARGSENLALRGSFARNRSSIVIVLVLDLVLDFFLSSFGATHSAPGSAPLPGSDGALLSRERKSCQVH